MPTDTSYHPQLFAPNQLDLPDTPTFTSQIGRSIWVIPPSFATP